MASWFHEELYPDYTDSPNRSERCPGYRLYVGENDGGVGVVFQHASADPGSGQVTGIFITPDQARDVIDALNEAITHAESKRR